jgi:hypothetical protein
MTTTRQRFSNRRNATLSTGPMTEAGLRRSSENSVKHGLTARYFSHFPEEEQEFEEFCNSIVGDYAPVGAVETELAFMNAADMFRARRAVFIETKLAKEARNRERDRVEELKAGRRQPPEDGKLDSPYARGLLRPLGLVGRYRRQIVHDCRTGDDYLRQVQAKRKSERRQARPADTTSEADPTVEVGADAAKRRTREKRPFSRQEDWGRPSANPSSSTEDDWGRPSAHPSSSSGDDWGRPSTDPLA